MKDVFVWLPDIAANTALAQPDHGAKLEDFAIRAYYYTSLVGTHEKVENTKRALRLLGFQPEVFKRPADQKKSKGVDITITKDMLVHAFHNNYDVAVLIAGDGDYRVARLPR